MRGAWLCGLALTGCAAQTGAPDRESLGAAAEADETSPCAPSIDHSIWVRDLRVVDDPVHTGRGGAWSLRETVAGIAPDGMTPERTLSKTMQMMLDLCPYSPGTNGTFAPAYGVHCDPNPPFASGVLKDVDELPTKLIGIVNRVDLATPDTPSGELRFLYQIFPVDSSPPVPTTPPPSSGNPTQRSSHAASAWLLNFEFDLAAVRDHDGQPISRAVWASRWAALSQHALGSAEYNAALAELTRLVTRRGAAPDRPNGSALRRLRFSMPHWNYGGFSDAIWRVNSRELDANGDLVRSGALERTPVHWWGNTWSTPHGTPGSLVTYLVDHEAGVLAGTHELPADAPFKPGVEFEASAGAGRYLASVPFASANLPSEWTAERYDAVVSAFTKVTCDGCHASTGTRGVHAWRRRDSEPAELSPFVQSQLPLRANAVGRLLCDE